MLETAIKEYYNHAHTPSVLLVIPSEESSGYPGNIMLGSLAVDFYYSYYLEMLSIALLPTGT